MILSIKLNKEASIEQVIYLLSEIASRAGDESMVQLREGSLRVELSIANYTSDELEQEAVLLSLRDAVSALPFIEHALAYRSVAEEEKEHKEGNG